MGDILKTLQALQNTPVPNLLVIGGIVLLLLAFVGKFGAMVELPQSRQKWAGIIGALLLMLGISLFIIPPSLSSTTAQVTSPSLANTSTGTDSVSNPPTNTPTLTGMPPLPTNTSIATSSPLQTSSPIDTPTYTPSSTNTVMPQCQVNSDALNLREGPNTQFKIVDQMSRGTLFVAQKRTVDTTWVLGSGPITSGWTSASFLACTYDLNTLPIAETLPPTYTPTSTPTNTPTPTTQPPTPTPQPPSGSCLPGFVYRLAGPNDKVCVTQDSYAQAQADDSAAASRREVALYGPDTCKQGYVWRGAFPDDHVCVTGEVYAQTQADNAAAAERREPGGGAYGPDTCKQGYVWRGARPEDHVCVTGETRDQTALDNAAAASRKLLQYGPDTCKQGYVWREAFSGDHVCVTGEVRTQTQIDNSLAASRTVP